MKPEVKYGVGAIALLAVDYLVPVVDLGVTHTSIGNAAGLCSQASKMGFGGLAGGGPCEWAPVAHYVLLAAALGLVIFAARAFLAAKKAQGPG
jgi:hypothetical protein